MKHLYTLITVGTLALYAATGAAGQSMYVNPSLYHNPRLVVTDTATVKALICTLDSFFRSKNESLTANAWWSAEDFRLYQQPYAELYQAEFSPRLQDSLHFRPTLLELLPAGPDAYLAKIAYLGQETDGFSSLRIIYNIQITKQDGRYCLSKVTGYQTRSWARHTAGSIDFIVSPGRTYNPAEAQRLDSLNQRYASLLQMPLVHATYYSCTDSREMFTIKGFDYIPNMYFADSGGQADAGAAIIYSAINSEWYPHELAHLYLNKIAGSKGGYLATEGACTFLGGSLNLSLQTHSKGLKAFVEAHPGTDLFALLLHETQVTATTSSTYTLGGIITAAVYEQYGVQGLKDWLQTGDEPQQLRSFFHEKFKLHTREAISHWLQQQLKRAADNTLR